MPDDAGPPVVRQQDSGIVYVEAEIAIPNPRDAVYAFWRDLENLPQFMERVASVTAIGPWLSRWVLRTTRTPFVVLEVEVVAQVTGELIAWRTIGPPGLAPDYSHQVRFSEVDPAGTLVRTALACREDRPAAQLLGDDAARQVASDLQRFRALMAAA